ncbi:MAG: pilus assembly protein [Acidobacteriota bacterium]|nr:pilus assembly protein [Acidobacteriota bacterium]
MGQKHLLGLHRIRRAKSLRARLRGLRGESGSALIELALVVGILGVPLLLGTAQMGVLGYDSIEITDAANAGALYGMQSATYASNNSGITTAAQAEATDFGTQLTVTPTNYWVCATAMTGTQYSGTNGQSNATAACTGAGNRAVQFVQVNTSASVTPVVHWSVLPASLTLNGKAVMEVQQ